MKTPWPKVRVVEYALLKRKWEVQIVDYSDKYRPYSSVPIARFKTFREARKFGLKLKLFLKNRYKK